MAKSSAGQSSISRAVRLIEAFDTGVRDLSLSELSARSGLPVSTAHRLAAELVDLGLFERVEQRRYRIGLRLWELAVRTPGAIGIREIALPYLRRLQAVVRQHTHLSVLQGSDVLYLEVLGRIGPGVDFTVVGKRLPFFATSSGLVLVAFSEPDERDRILAVPRPAHEHTPSLNRTELMKQLRSIRARGYAVTHGYITPDMTAIAVPVIGPFGTPLAGLGVVVPTETMNEPAIADQLRAASAAIAAAVRRRYAGGGIAEPQGREEET